MNNKLPSSVIDCWRLHAHFNFDSLSLIYADSPLAAVTVEEIFQEMGVYDDDDDVVDDVVMITNLSPALSPIPPSPAPVKVGYHCRI